MADAFDGLDAHFWDVARGSDSESPDEAHDWVFMMTPEDWSLLEAALPTRPPAWREECAYILGQGPFGPSVRLLTRALFDTDTSVGIQAGISLAAQYLEQRPIPYLNPEIRLQLVSLVTAAKGTHVGEIQDLLDLGSQ